MARLSSIFGELRGSIGGNTFSLNKSGQIIRQRVSPTQPRTQNQTTARSNFARSVQQWASLSAENQSSWRGFAADANRFNPIKRMNTGNQTGNNAYTSCNAFAANLSASYSTGFEIYNSSDVFQAGDYANVISVPQTAPLSGATATIKGPGEITYPISLREIVSLGSGQFDISINIGDGAAPLPFDPAILNLRDIYENDLGLAGYISSYVSSDGATPKTDFQTLILSAPALTWTSSIVATRYFRWNLNILSNLNGSKFGYRVGAWAKITIFASSLYGTGVRLGSAYIQLT